MSEQVVRPTPRPLAKRPARRKKSPAVVAIQWGFGALLLFAVVFGLYRATLESDSQAVEGGVPREILNLQLDQVMTGAAALADVEKLHGKDVQLDSAVVAHYRQNDEAATLWVGDAGSEDAAKKLTDLMTQKIGKGTSFFSEPKTINMDGRVVYSLSGRDQLKHYYYQTGSKVVWLGFPPRYSEQALKAVMMLVR